MGNAFCTFHESLGVLRRRLRALGLRSRGPVIYQFYYFEYRASAFRSGSRIDFTDGIIDGFRLLLQDLNFIPILVQLPKSKIRVESILYSSSMMDQLEGLAIIVNRPSQNLSVYLERITELATPDYFQPSDPVQCVAIQVAAHCAATADLEWLQRFALSVEPFQGLYPEIRYIIKMCVKRSTNYHVAFQLPSKDLHTALMDIGATFVENVYSVTLDGRTVECEASDTPTGCTVDYTGGDLEAFRHLAGRLSRLAKHGQAYLPIPPLDPIPCESKSEWLANRECPHIRKVRLRLLALFS